MEGIKFDATSILVGACAGLAAGGVLSYILCRRSFNAKLDTEIASVKNHYQLRYQAASDSADALEWDVSALAERLGQPDVLVGFSDPARDGEVSWIQPTDLIVKEAIGDDQIVEVADVDDEPELSPEDVSADVPWPPANRDRSRPYVISEGEFAEGVPEGFHQCLTIKWYDKDKVLLDDRDQPIPDVRRTTGQLHKSLFGGVSGDPNIMYVRNERLEVDFEICFDERAYTDAVLNYGNPNPRNVL